jgi:hypothetical protein
MDLFLQRVYVNEIAGQARFSLNAIGVLNDSLRHLHSPCQNSDESRFFHAEVFRQTHSLLTHASNISRLFWPPKAKPHKGEEKSSFADRASFTEMRGATLRKLFELEDCNPLKNRTIRDHLEHYDERLDHWSNTSAIRNIASDTIGPPNSIVGLDPADTMRWFDPTRNALRFRGEEFELQPLATSINQILLQAETIKETL